MSKYNKRQIEIMNALAEFHINNHTEEDQILKTIEEMSELIKELLKWIWVKRGFAQDISRRTLLDEIFDLDLMLFQLKKYFVEGDQGYYRNIVNEKLYREVNRWGIKF